MLNGLTSIKNTKGKVMTTDWLTFCSTQCKSREYQQDFKTIKIILLMNIRKYIFVKKIVINQNNLYV